MPFSSIQKGCLQSSLLLAVAAAAAGLVLGAFGAAAVRAFRGGGAACLVARLGVLDTCSFGACASARLTRLAALPSTLGSLAAGLGAGAVGCAGWAGSA